MSAQQPAGSLPFMSGTLRAVLKRSIAAWRDQPLIDANALPPEVRAVIAPFMRAGMRYLTRQQAHRMMEAGCALLEDRERLARQLVNLARTAVSLEMASAMIELVSPTELKALPPADMTRLEAESRLLQRQLDKVRRTLSNGYEEDG